jgi:hypothetical protein
VYAGYPQTWTVGADVGGSLPALPEVEPGRSWRRVRASDESGEALAHGPGFKIFPAISDNHPE